jgi:hypothetical protein
MKKPKDVTELATRLANANATPLVAQVPAPTMPEAREAQALQPPKQRRNAPNRGSVAVFLRLSQDLYDSYDAEAVRRTREKGRGVTVQQVILDRLAEAQP